MIKFFYREDGSPAMKFHEKESKKVSYQGIAHLEMNGIHFIAVGDYYDGHAGLVPGKVYSLTVEA